jgi:hypothetical protein
MLHRFITDRVARARPRTPGEEVGQNLVLVTPQVSRADLVAEWSIGMRLLQWAVWNWQVLTAAVPAAGTEC